jgi:hydroxymethylpyrimidine/phosphomethylpyrimidine kinase
MHLKCINCVPMALATNRTRPVVLAIAGYDPSSGAGITADIKTITAQGCYGVTCITSLTVQSTRGVRSVEPVEGKLITEILDELVTDIEISAVKIGMLGTAEAARAVTGFLKRYSPRRVVLDPVLVSSSGASLLSKDGLPLLKDRLLGLVSVITPNAAEAAALTGLKVDTLEEMELAARRLRQMGARSVIVTGGHLDPPSDLIIAESIPNPVILTGVKVSSRSTHGTGCAFSTALACKLAQGRNLMPAAKAAKSFVETSLKNAPLLGRGIGPVV